MANKNAMDIIDTEIKTEWPNWKDYSKKDYFVKIATLLPDHEHERMIPQQGFDPRYATLRGSCYAFVIDGKFVKQGKTETTLKERIQSYNCGKQKARDKGTCSVSNYKCLQSVLAINKPVELYAFFAPPTYFEYEGQRIEASVSPAKYIEGQLNAIAEKDFNGKLPWCVQR